MQRVLTREQQAVREELAGLPSLPLPPSCTPKSGYWGSGLEGEALPRSSMHTEMYGNNVKKCAPPPQIAAYSPPRRAHLRVGLAQLLVVELVDRIDAVHVRAVPQRDYPDGTGWTEEDLLSQTACGALHCHGVTRPLVFQAVKGVACPVRPPPPAHGRALLPLLWGCGFGLWPQKRPLDRGPRA